MKKEINSTSFFSIDDMGVSNVFRMVIHLVVDERKTFGGICSALSHLTGDHSISTDDYYSALNYLMHNIPETEYLKNSYKLANSIQPFPDFDVFCRSSHWWHPTQWDDRIKWLEEQIYLLDDEIEYNIVKQANKKED